MRTLQIIKRAFNYIIKGIPVKQVTAQITTLPPNQLLINRIALITGGTSGIGFQIAKAFLNSGASVCITGRELSKVNTTCDKLKLYSSLFKNRVYGIVLDNKDVPSYHIKIREVLEHFGRIDILVNNAGILGGEIATCSEETIPPTTL